jgi:hypothetical protein
MRKITFVAELTYDDELMHGDDTDWFYNEILLGENLVLHDNGDLGDDIGTIKVLILSDDKEESNG